MKENMYDEMVKRVLKVLSDGHTHTLKDRANKLANLCYLTYQTAYYRLTGRIPFTVDEIMTICERYNINADWLLFGIGEKRRKNNG